MDDPKHIILGSIALLIIFFSSCTKESAGPNFIYNIETEFEIRPIEILSPLGSELALEFSSLHEDVCSSSEILYQYYLENGVAVIKLQDITAGSSCINDSDSPKTLIALDGSTDQSLDIQITIQEVIENTGRIDDMGDHYEVSMNSLNGIRINNPDLMKVRPYMIWGGVDYDLADSQSIAQAFIDEIKQATSANNISSGYYGHFEISDQEVRLLSEQMTHENRKTLAINTPESLANLTNIINAYRLQYPDMRFFLHNGLGESL